MNDLARVAAFLYREARLLDEKRYEEWRDLFAEDGLYWVPAAPGQTDPFEEMSLFCDDRALLDARVVRLRHPRAHANVPAPRTVHALANVELLAPTDGLAEATAVVTVTEWHESRQTIYAGRARWMLRPTPDGDFRIRLKRVDLVNADAFHQSITVPL